MIIGPYTERPTDRHVRDRSALLSGDQVPPPPPVEPMPAVARRFPEEPSALTAVLEDRGLALVALDEPLSNERFLVLGDLLGDALPETDPAVQPYVEDRVILNLRSEHGQTDDASLQPFATNFLTLHTESSGRRAEDQPRYIVLMCCDPGDAPTRALTVLVPMAAVDGRLTARDRAILARTYYARNADGPPILRERAGRSVFSFRDFRGQPLDWTYAGDDADEAEVNGAIAQLLAAMYASGAAFAVRWTPAMLVILDNTFFFHAKTAGAATPTGRARHLKRLRVLARQPAMSVRPPLFAKVAVRPRAGVPPDARGAAAQADAIGPHIGRFAPPVDDRLLDLYSRARDPGDPFELRDLWLGRVEHELEGPSLRPWLAEQWRATRPRRTVTEEEILRSRATVRFVKEMFNWFFRDDLYGDLRSDDHVILSSGSVAEESWGLPEALKECIRYALARDWYGYSDSRGRVPAREAVAAYESVRIDGATYEADNIALTTGGTSAISSLADFLLLEAPRRAPALCAIPNYPPLVESIARRGDIRLVPLPVKDGRTVLDPLIDALEPDTPLVMLQTVANPTGALVDEASLGRLIRAAGPSTMVLLDECHEWLGPFLRCSPERASPNVVRVSSMSKVWSAPGLKIGWIVAAPGFIAGYYEYASTTFGGPPSVFSTLVEVVARMERWRLTSVDPGAAEVAEFHPGYDLTLTRLQAAYQSYLSEWTDRDETLQVLRSTAVAGFARAAKVVPPRYSINAALELECWDDSYRCFRDLLRETGVAVFPGLLAFCLSGGVVRVTTARPWPELSSAIERIEALEARRRAGRALSLTRRLS